MLLLVENSILQSRVFQSPPILLLQAHSYTRLGKMAGIFLLELPRNDRTAQGWQVSLALEASCQAGDVFLGVTAGRSNAGLFRVRLQDGG